MPTDAATLDDPSAPLLTPEQQDDIVFRNVLLDITEAARDFADLLLATARRAQEPDDILRLAAAFDRTSRCARRGILLARHLRRPAKPANEPGRPAAVRLAQPAAATPHAGPSQASLLPEAKQRELRDRLDAIDPSPDIALGRTPVPDALVALHRDLKQVFEELPKPLYKPKLATPSAPIPDG